MKILPNNISKFLSGDFKNSKAVLLFGPDTGLVATRAAQLQSNISNNSDNYCHVHFEYDQILKNISLLHLEINSISMFGDQKIITISNVEGSMHKDITNILSTIDHNNFIIFKSGDLPPSSGIRKFFDTNPEVASIACYHLESAEIRSLLIKTLNCNELKVPHPSVIDYIIENIKGDYLSIISEIEKLMVLFQQDEDIALDKIKSIINKNSYAVDYNVLIGYMIVGNRSKAETEFEKMISAGTSVVTIARTIASYIVKLLKVQTLISQGKSEAFAMSTLKPPIFFKHEVDFKAGLKRYSTGKLLTILELITDLEIKCKRSSVDSRMLYDEFMTLL